MQIETHQFFKADYYSLSNFICQMNKNPSVGDGENNQWVRKKVNYVEKIQIIGKILLRRLAKNNSLFTIEFEQTG